MKFNRAKYKLEAKKILLGNHTKPVLLSLVFAIILTIVYILVFSNQLSSNFNQSLETINQMRPETFDQTFDYLQHQQERTSFWSQLLGIIFIFAQSLLSYGFCSFLVKFKKDRATKTSEVFKLFSKRGILTAVVLSLLTFAFTFCYLLPLTIVSQTNLEQTEYYPIIILLAVLVTIPLFIWGITMISAFSLLPFAVISNPNLTVGQAVKHVNQITKGYKFKIVIFYLSFMGWYLLGMLTLLIAFLWIYPYQEISLLNLYEDLSAQEERLLSNEEEIATIIRPKENQN